MASFGSTDLSQFIGEIMRKISIMAVAAASFLIAPLAVAQEPEAPAPTEEPTPAPTAEPTDEPAPAPAPTDEPAPSEEPAPAPEPQA